MAACALSRGEPEQWAAGTRPGEAPPTASTRGLERGKAGGTAPGRALKSSHKCGTAGHGPTRSRPQSIPAAPSPVSQLPQSPAGGSATCPSLTTWQRSALLPCGSKPPLLMCSALRQLQCGTRGSQRVALLQQRRQRRQVRRLPPP